MKITWTRLTDDQNENCASVDCGHTARFHMEAGDVGSYYCDACCRKIEAQMSAIDFGTGVNRIAPDGTVTNIRIEDFFR